jgi:hypothetical protein
MASGHGMCGKCRTRTVTVRLGATPCTVDWPQAEHGDIAVEHTAAGAWHGRYAPVGEPLAVTEHRYRRHDCGEPQPDLTEPQRASAQ